MILLDFYQLSFSELMQAINIQKTENINLDSVRYMILNSLRSVMVKFKDNYGKLVIVSDSKNYWRSQVFSYYKKNRKKKMNNSYLDWNHIFFLINTVKKEITDNFPFRFIQIESVEADDIIAVLTKNFYKYEKILIISKDKDFTQLQKYSTDRIKQYDVSTRRFITNENPDRFLKSLIIEGDFGDGIPSILSDDDAFVNENKPKKKIRKHFLNQLLDTENMFNFLTPEEMKNFERNQQLIDFDYIPKEIENVILDEFVEFQTSNDLTTIYKYLTDKKLKPLITNIGDFHQDD